MGLILMGLIRMVFFSAGISGWKVVDGVSYQW